MQDQYGIYYYPNPSNKNYKMYVRSNNGVVEFRLHNQDDPNLFQEHGWITYEMVKQAAAMYNSKDKKNPLNIYDFDVALNVLKEHQEE